MSTKSMPWLMLFSRIVLFLFFQSIFTLGFFLAGSTAAWEASANWWPFVVAATNLVGVFWLVRIFRSEGRRYWDVFKIDRKNMLRDVATLLGSFVIGGPLSVIPNILLGGWLFGDSSATLELFVRPLPLWAAYAAILLFPVTQGLAEGATYFAYVMPRFESQGMNKIWALSLPALMLGLQHLAMPLLFDYRFILWRALMYIPFAFFTGIILSWRPRLLPYIAIIHVLMNMSFATMFLSVAY